MNNNANDSLTISGNKTLSVTGNQTDTISGTKTATITGKLTESLLAEKKLTVASKTDETYSGDRTVILDNLANDSLTIAGNKILSVTGNQTDTISGTKTTTITGKLIESLLAEKKLTVASKTDETYSGDRTVILDNLANDSLTITGNKILSVTGNQTDTISGTKTTTITRNVTESLLAEKKLTVASKTDETYSGDRTVILDNLANDSLTIAGNKILTVTGNQTDTISGTKTTTITKNVTESLLAEKKLTVASKTDETYSGDRTVILDNLANDSLTIAGSKILTVTGNQTDTISGSKTATITGKLTESLLAEKKLTVASKTDETYSGDRTVILDNLANDSLTIAGNKTLTVTGNQTDTISGNKTINITSNYDLNVTNDINIDSNNKINIKADDKILINTKFLDIGNKVNNSTLTLYGELEVSGDIGCNDIVVGNNVEVGKNVYIEDDLTIGDIDDKTSNQIIYGGLTINGPSKFIKFDSKTVDIDTIGTVSIDSSAGNINIGTNSNDRTLNIGNNSNNTQINLIGGKKLDLAAPIIYLNVDNEVNISNNLTIGGDLIVNGTITTVHSDVVVLKDPVLTLGGDNDATIADLNSDRGVDFKYWNGSNGKLGFFGYDYSKDKFTFIKEATDGIFYTGILGSAEFAGITNSIGGLTLTGNGDSNWSTTSGKLDILGNDGVKINSSSDILELTDETAKIKIDGTGGIYFNDMTTLQMNASSNIIVNTTGGSINIGSNDNSSSINIGTNGSGRKISIGNNNNTSSLFLNSGTGGINLGTSDGGSINISAVGASSTFNLESKNDNDNLTFALLGDYDSKLILSSEGNGVNAIEIEAISGGISVKSNKKIDLQAEEELVINDLGVNVDFRIETLNKTNSFFVNGQNGKIGIDNNQPDNDLDIGNKNSTDRKLNLNSSSSQYLMLQTNGSNNKSFLIAGDNSTKNNTISFVTTKIGIESEAMVLDENKKLTILGDLQVADSLKFSSGNIIDENSLLLDSLKLTINSSGSEIDALKFNSDGGMKLSSEKEISIQGKNKVVFNNSNLQVNFCINSFNQDNSFFIDGTSGNIGIKSNNPKVSLYFNSNDAIKIPNGTTLERPSDLEKGYIRYNSTLDQFEGYGAGNSWGSLGGVIDIDQDTYIKAESAAGADNDELWFYTEGTEKMRITNDGNVGIGVINPDTKLQVNGNIKLEKGGIISNEIDGNVKIEATNTVITGNMIINGSIPTINVSDLFVKDKLIELGKVDDPTDLTALNGGLILNGDTNKSILWSNSNWNFNQNINLENKIYKIDNVEILSKTNLGSSVITSSLTTVGQLNSGSITSGFGPINIGSDNIETSGKGSFGELEVDNIFFKENTIGHKNDTDLLELIDNHLKINGNLIVTGTINQSIGTGNNNSSGDFESIFVNDIIIDNNRIGHKNDSDLIEIIENQVKINGDLVLTGVLNQIGSSSDIFEYLEVDDIVIDNNSIGHKDDSDLMKFSQNEITINGNLVVTGTVTQDGNLTGEGNFTSLIVDDIIFNGNEIGHKDNNSLLTLSADIINLNGDFKLEQNRSYQIDDSSVLTETTLGTTVINSSLQYVGVLDGGSISSNFGEINNGSSPITTTGKATFGEVEIDEIIINDNKIGIKSDTNLITLSDELIELSGDIKLAENKSYQIDNSIVLTETTLGSTVINSSLQYVGILDGGSITSNFGDINNGSSSITTTGKATFGEAEIDQIIINDNQIGIKTDTDLITLTNELIESTADIKLAENKSYQIDDSIVLTENTLGTTVINSSLQYVGILDGGSITSNFGDINNGSSSITTTGKATFGEAEIDEILIDENQIGIKLIQI